MTLRVPKLRRLPFETASIERYQRREASIEESLVEMYLAGVSVRRVEDITEALWGTRVSSSTVSRLNQKTYRHIEAWRNREIPEEFPYVYLDGVVLKRSWVGEVRRRLEGICAAAGVSLEELGVQVITAPAVRLDMPADRAKLEHTVEQLQPRLLVLDPFVRLHRIDENASGKVAWLASSSGAQDVERTATPTRPVLAADLATHQATTRRTSSVPWPGSHSLYSAREPIAGTP